MYQRARLGRMAPLRRHSTARSMRMRKWFGENIEFSWRTYCLAVIQSVKHGVHPSDMPPRLKERRLGQPSSLSSCQEIHCK